VEKSGTRME